MKKRKPALPLSENKHLLRWVEKTAALTEPDAIHWVDGSQEEYDQLCGEMVASGTFIKLNEKLWPGCFYARSDPSDVARVEDRTFICSLSKDNAGPTNNWEDPFEMRRKLKELFNGCHAGPHHVRAALQHGPVGSPMSQIGVQLTDSPYVVVNMRIMARIGLPVFKEIDKDDKARGAVHAHRRRAAGARPEGRALAVQPRKIHRSFSRDARDLVVRLGLRRQRAARQEVLRAAHRLQHGARRGLDGRAHAHPGRGEPGGREDLRGRRVPQRLRQDQLRHADSAARVSRAGRCGRWATTSPGSGRTRTAACAPSIPRPASSASRPARRRKTNPNAMATLAREHDLHQRRAHARRRRVVGGHDRRAARRVPRLAGQELDAGDRARRPAPRPRIRTRASPRRPRNVPPSIRPGKIPKACRSAPSSSAAAAPPRCRWSTRRSTGAPASTWAPPWARRRPPPRGRRRQGAPRSHGHAALLRLSHGRLFPALDQDAALAQRNAAHLPRELVPQGCRTASSSGRASARTCAC